MAPPESILRFLGLEAEDFEFLDRYRPLLHANAERFAEDFYEYLFGQPETAAVLKGISTQKLAQLLRKQAAHFDRLLTDRFDEQYQEDLHYVGQFHHRLAIEPVWMTGAYALYQEHLDNQAGSSGVPPRDRPRLRQILSRLIFADLCLQLQGYASAQSEDDASRAALTRVLVHTVLAERSGGTWDSLLRRMCHGIVSEGTHILAAWSAVAEPGVRGLTLTCVAGHMSEHASACLLHQPGDPCTRALETGKPVAIGADAAAGMAWLRDILPDACQDVGFFPFGKAESGYTGLGIFAADSAHYFERIGFEHFQAFSQFGELALNLREQSLRDALTGLPNRSLFHDRLTHALSGANRRERLLAVGVLDLDGFKAVNDRYGHAWGDAVLKRLSARLQRAMRPRDTLARLGGDEFGLLLDELDDVSQLEALTDRLLEAVRSPLPSEHSLPSLSASIGFTLFPLDDGDAETLLRHADMAMYSSKNAGGDRSSIYSTVLSEEAKWQGRVSRELRRAVERGELVLHYQPQVDMATGTATGVEALLRWNHPTRGLLSPGEFIDALEGGTASRQVGCYVLDTALRQMVAWQEAGLSLRMAVNISAHHLLAPQFLGDLRDALARYPISTAMLEIEVTETTAIADLAAARETLAACRNLGVTVALDDFGTGNAPLSYLQTLPADSLKIDRGFVADILDNPMDAAIVAGVITSARLVGLEVIGEGVESTEHGCLLLQLGCRRAQGYVITKPMPAEDIPRWVASYRTDPAWQSWADRPWRPENYSLLLVTLAHGRRSRMTLERLDQASAQVPEHLLRLDAERHCVLGRWLEGEGQARFGDTAHYREVRALHDQFHQLAREVAACKERGQVEALKEVLGEMRVASLAIQDRLRVWIDGLHGS